MRTRGREEGSGAAAGTLGPTRRQTDRLWGVGRKGESSGATSQLENLGRPPSLVSPAVNRNLFMQNTGTEPYCARTGAAVDTAEETGQKRLPRESQPEREAEDK